VQPPPAKLPVGVLGATGTVGQVMVRMLADHPWFEARRLMASPRSVGKPYGEAARWVQPVELPPAQAALPIAPCEPTGEPGIVFSALDADVAGPIERRFAEAGHVVVSNARNHRLEPDVPLVVPEVNPDHLELCRQQAFGTGAILTNPNCSTIALALALCPLVQRFGLTRVHVVTLQAVSGAGLPGVPSLEMADNVIPFIASEEEKLGRETAKIFGRLEGGRVHEAVLPVDAHCNRVAVSDGHTLCVSVDLERAAEPDELVAAWEEFRGAPQEHGLPTAPARPTRYLTAPDAPQPRLHRQLEGGMGVAIGRLRRLASFDYGFVALSHNTVRGAAGGALLVAELARARGLV